MPRHTTMPERTQRTPFGDVTLTSRWMRDRYYLVASSHSLQALKWMFPRMEVSPKLFRKQFRHAFKPSPKPITVERTLRKVCARLQQHWYERFQAEAQHDDGEFSAGEVLLPETVGALFDHLQEVRRVRLKPNTVQADANDLRNWLTVLDRHMCLASVTDDLLQQAFDRLCGSMKPRSANRALGTLKAYFNWAMNKGLLVGAPHKNVRQARVQRTHRSVQWWTGEEVQLALRCAREIDAEVRDASQRSKLSNIARNRCRGLDRDRIDNYATAELLVALGCFLGLRFEEIVMQRWQDVDLDARSLATGEPQPVCHVVPHNGWEPKDKEARTIPIHRDLAAILRKHRQAEGFLLEPRINRKKKGGSRRVYRYDPTCLWHKIVKRVVAAGGKRITAYAMRHTFASNLLMAGVSDVKVGRWLGHADTRMVHAHYGHLLAFDDDINRL